MCQPHVRTVVRTLFLVVLTAHLIGCFPVELDVKDGKLLVSREEGFFVFDPVAAKGVKVATPVQGKPIFARFAPNGKEVLVISSTGYQEFTFVVAPLADGKGREIFKGKSTAYVSYAPDGNSLAIAMMSEKEVPGFKQPMPELLVLPATGGKPQVLARNVGSLYRWFADSKRLLVFECLTKSENSRYFGTLMIVDVATGKKTPLAAAAITQEFFLDISPDNKKALFTALRADKPGSNVEKGDESNMVAFEVDLASAALRSTGARARYVLYAPSGKQVLVGAPSEGFTLTGLDLKVADPGLTKFKTIATDAHMPMSISGEGMMYPGWVDEQHIYYFVQRHVFGTEVKNVQLYLLGSDGKSKKCLQPHLDLEALKG